MAEKYKVTVLYDAAEDQEKARAQAEGRPHPVAAEQVVEALCRRGHDARSMPVENKLRSLVSALEKDDADILFNLCESIANATRFEHNLCGVLELLGKPFTGTGSAGWLLAQDKALCKKILQFHGLPCPRFSCIDAGRVDWADDLAFPLFVKPANEDASIGIDRNSVVHSVKELLERISHVHEVVKAPALVEEYIDWREIYVGVLGNGAPDVLPILEWDLSKVTDGPRIASAEAKWDTDSEAYKAPEIFPDDIPPGVVRQIHQSAITAFQALKLNDYARVDMRLRRRSTAGQAGELVRPATQSPAPGGERTRADRRKDCGSADNPHDVAAPDCDWEVFIIEVNPNPWLEKRSEFSMAARRHGLSYPDMLERIIELALKRQR